MKLFLQCIDVIFRHEGGYVNHPDDPGGETNMGIAKRFFPDEDIKNMTRKRAQEIYYHNYWKPMNLEGIVDPLVVLHMFDMGVNAGRHTAVKLAQKIVKTEQDGIMGPITTEAINADWDFLSKYIEARKKYYKDLAARKKKLKVFLNGWLNRVDGTHF